MAKNLFSDNKSKPLIGGEGQPNVSLQGTQALGKINLDDGSPADQIGSLIKSINKVSKATTGGSLFGSGSKSDTKVKNAVLSEYENKMQTLYNSRKQNPNITVGEINARAEAYTNDFIAANGAYASQVTTAYENFTKRHTGLSNAKANEASIIDGKRELVKNAVKEYGTNVIKVNEHGEMDYEATLHTASKLKFSEKELELATKKKDLVDANVAIAANKFMGSAVDSFLPDAIDFFAANKDNPEVLAKGMEEFIMHKNKALSKLRSKLLSNGYSPEKTDELVQQWDKTFKPLLDNIKESDDMTAHIYSTIQNRASIEASVALPMVTKIKAATKGMSKDAIDKIMEADSGNGKSISQVLASDVVGYTHNITKTVEDFTKVAAHGEIPKDISDRDPKQVQTLLDQSKTLVKEGSKVKGLPPTGFYNGLTSINKLMNSTDLSPNQVIRSGSILTPAVEQHLILGETDIEHKEEFQKSVIAALDIADKVVQNFSTSGTGTSVKLTYNKGLGEVQAHTTNETDRANVEALQNATRFLVRFKKYRPDLAKLKDEELRIQIANGAQVGSTIPRQQQQPDPKVTEQLFNYNSQGPLGFQPSENTPLVAESKPKNDTVSSQVSQIDSSSSVVKPSVNASQEVNKGVSNEKIYREDIEALIRGGLQITDKNNQPLKPEDFPSRDGTPSQQDGGRTEHSKKDSLKDLSAKYIGYEEGFSTKMYRDSNKKHHYKTVGIGFNMEQTGAKEIWNKAGVSVNFDDVLNGKKEITREDAIKLQSVMSEKLDTYGRKLFNNYDSLDVFRKAAIHSLLYQTGYEGTKLFKKFRKAVENNDWEKAKYEVIHSRMGKQTPNRAKRIGEMILTGKPFEEIESNLIERGEISPQNRVS